MDGISSVLVAVVGLEVGEAEEVLDDMGFRFFAGEHEEAHLHSIMDWLTLVLAVIDVCSLSVFCKPTFT